MVTNQMRPMDDFVRDDGAGPESYPSERPINYNIDTPLSHWRSGAPWPPKGTEQRLAQMRTYRLLFDGDLSAILADQYPIRINWFRRMSTHLADILLAYPPQIVQSAASGPRVEMINEQLPDAVYQAVIDQTRYGVGVFRARRDEMDMPHVEAVNPEFWFPGDDGDVFAIPQPQDPTRAKVLVERHMLDGRYSRAMFEAGGSDYQQAEGLPAGGALGSVLEAYQMPTVHGRAVWPVPRQPANGEWGQSLYQDMIPLVAEHCRRLSKQSEVLNRHADPLLVFKRDPRQAPYTDTPPGEDETIRVYAERVFLDKWRTSWVSVVPPEFVDVSYISWDAQMQASFNHIDRVQAALYATTQIPASLYGTLTGEVTAVGNVSLKKAYAPTFAYTLRLQQQFIRALKRVCRAALGRDVEIEWPNAIEEFDQQTIVNLGGRVDEESEPEATTPEVRD